jgi:hypothetical protein
MPRKQRFKPSRKPKPIPSAQAQEGGEPGNTGAQDHAGAPISDGDHPDIIPGDRAPQYREQSGP